VGKKDEKRSAGNYIFWFFFGVIIIIAIYLPFFAPNLRFQLGTFLSQLFELIGKLSIFFGVLFFIWGIAGLFCGRSFRAVRLLILGILMIWIGSFFVAPTVGIGLHREEIPRGYY